MAGSAAFGAAAATAIVCRSTRGARSRRSPRVGPIRYVAEIEWHILWIVRHLDYLGRKLRQWWYLW